MSIYKSGLTILDIYGSACSRAVENILNTIEKLIQHSKLVQMRLYFLLAAHACIRISRYKRLKKASSLYLCIKDVYC